MAEIVNLDELVPDDITFEFRGQTYPFPGDIDTETTFRLARMLRELGRAEEAASEQREDEAAQEEQEKLTLAVEGELLKLFQRRTPDLESLPFGATGFQVVLLHVLAALGFSAPADPPKRERTKTATRSRRKSSTPSV